MTISARYTLTRHDVEEYVAFKRGQQRHERLISLVAAGVALSVFVAIPLGYAWPTRGWSWWVFLVAPASGFLVSAGGIAAEQALTAYRLRRAWDGSSFELTLDQDGIVFAGPHGRSELGWADVESSIHTPSHWYIGLAAVDVWMPRSAYQGPSERAAWEKVLKWTSAACEDLVQKVLRDTAARKA